MTAAEFTKMVRKELKKAGGQLIIRNKRVLESDSTGFFYIKRSKPFIEIARNNENFLQVLAHEYSHYLIAQKNAKEWINYLNCPYELDKILKNKGLCKLILPHLVLERAVEILVIKLIDKYHLPINIKKYCQEANLTLLKYVEIYNGGDWPKTTHEMNLQLSKNLKDSIMSMKELLNSKFFSTPFPY